MATSCNVSSVSTVPKSFMCSLKCSVHGLPEMKAIVSAPPCPTLPRDPSASPLGTKSFHLNSHVPCQRHSFPPCVKRRSALACMTYEIHAECSAFQAVQEQHCTSPVPATAEKGCTCSDLQLTVCLDCALGRNCVQSARCLGLTRLTPDIPMAFGRYAATAPLE